MLVVCFRKVYAGARVTPHKVIEAFAGYLQTRLNYVSVLTKRG